MSDALLSAKSQAAYPPFFDVVCKNPADDKLYLVFFDHEKDDQQRDPFWCRFTSQD